MLKQIFFYCNSRYYSPELWRFISLDSIEYLDPQSINGLNLYCYCMNNPIMGYDPSGNYMILPFWNMKYISKIFEDIKNFNLFNKDSNVVFDANYFSFYKGSLVIKHQTNLSSFGVFGIIFLHVNHTEEDDLNHEWGHNIQEKILGSPLYMIRIAIPSMIGCALRYNDEEYFSFPWERSADFFGM